LFPSWLDNENSSPALAHDNDNDCDDNENDNDANSPAEHIVVLLHRWQAVADSHKMGGAEQLTSAMVDPNVFKKADI
jgi:hypothetical protein